MKKVHILLVVAVALMFAGCTSVTERWDANAVTPQLRTSMVTDVEVTGKISGTSSTAMLFWIFQIGGDNTFAENVGFSSASPAGGAGVNPIIEGLANALDFAGKATRACKSAAAYKALKSSGADYILNPRYELKISDFAIYKEVTATVTGYGCKVKKFRQVPDNLIYGDKKN